MKETKTQIIGEAAFRKEKNKVPVAITVTGEDSLS